MIKLVRDIQPPPRSLPQAEDSVAFLAPLSHLEAIPTTMELSRIQNASPTFFSKYGLLFFFALALAYFEFIYAAWTFGGISADYVFHILFGIPAASVLFLISTLFSETINKYISGFILLLLIFFYSAQLVYYSIFNTPPQLYSIVGAGEATQFWDVVLSAVLKNGWALGLLFAPLLLIFCGKFRFVRLRPTAIGRVLALAFFCYGVAIFSMLPERDANFSRHSLYYRIASPELSIKKLGVFTTARLDLQRLIFGFEETEGATKTTSLAAMALAQIQPLAQAQPLPNEEPKSPTPATHNMLNIDFENLIANESDENIRAMHEYFAPMEPTQKNAYTGIFKGQNLVFITAESFSPYAISPELTPTLYAMSQEGFVFSNFYNPKWEVSTSDAEYVVHTGLIPKSGVWSMLKSSKNYLPFSPGNQFKKLGYLTKAYHNHDYTYYDRYKSMPNAGYDFKAVGYGLQIKDTWPESDLEMIEATTEEYISSQPFHTYYMTVSGHREYNFHGNYISKKNKSFVENLPYSDQVKAYLAANLEVEFAVKKLIERLDATGILENTVIALINDHYPYGLSNGSLNELAGRAVERNFELYKGVFILWKKNMTPIFVDKLASEIDILPTLSNLFGLEFDSRLLMGRDLFSDVPPLVVFLNRSWITDRTRFNPTTPPNDPERDMEYDKAINKIVADKFKYSAKILETDYYNKLIPK